MPKDRAIREAKSALGSLGFRTVNETPVERLTYDAGLRREAFPAQRYSLVGLGRLPDFSDDVCLSHDSINKERDVSLYLRRFSSCRSIHIQKPIRAHHRLAKVRQRLHARLRLSWRRLRPLEKLRLLLHERNRLIEFPRRRFRGIRQLPG